MASSKPALNALDLPGRPQDTRVVVAMSGGVDSSVAAGLLKRGGFDVVGITLQLYDAGKAARRAGSCCAGVDIADAAAAAEALGIPHYVLDYERRFRQAVIEPFAEAYARGETPVPCISCNQTVKFADLLDVARSLDAEALATGHYIRSARCPRRRSGGSRPRWGSASLKSPTARTSASWPRAHTPTSWKSSGPTPPGPARSSTSRAAC